MTNFYRQRKPAMKLRAKDQTLNQAVLTLLRVVGSGSRVFAPEEDTAEGYNAATDSLPSGAEKKGGKLRWITRR